MLELTNFRKQLRTQVRYEMHGPIVTDPTVIKDRVIEDRPDQYYSCGILYPKVVEEQIITEPAKEYDINNDDEFKYSHFSSLTDKIKLPEGNNEQIEKDYENDIDLTNQLKPSAISISFLTKNVDALNISLFFATYVEFSELQENGRARSSYRRIQHKRKFKIDLSGDKVESLSKDLLLRDDKAFLQFNIRSRTNDNGIRSVTVSLVNRLPSDRSSRVSFSDMIFQPQISVKIANAQGIFEPIDKARKFDDPELDELELQYRKVKAYCRGHGCAGDWVSKETNSSPYRLISNLMPEYEISGTEPRTNPFNAQNDLSFNFHKFSKIEVSLEENRREISQTLRPFLVDYSDWLSAQLEQVKELKTPHHTSIERIQARISESIARIKSGIEFLETDDEALKAFIIANRAMWLQQCHVKIPNRCIDQAFENPSNDLYVSQLERAWRPFQLAFVLMNLRSIPVKTDVKPPNHDLVDLIWFPTGGGKTEAYLGLAAFTIAFTRLKCPQASASTNVIMRYTLRLLTGQQFNRASTLICAMEYLRVHEQQFSWDVENYKIGPRVSIGLWVGRSLTPNTNKDAVSQLKLMRKKPDEQKNVFQVFFCPWCKGDLRYHTTENHNDNKKTYTGYDQKNREVVFICRDPKCPMDELPVLVVDEQIYANPPSLLIGTVDKFAQLAWKQETGSLFGLSENTSPPNLIIQDELHLISGPLGSIVAHYEYLIRAICDKAGYRPKIVASTATIRSAGDQVKKLFRSEVNIFPAPGFNFDDNYFSFQSNDEGKGRCYVGVFASATPSVVTAERNLAATLIQMPRLSFSDEKYYDFQPLKSNPEIKWPVPKKESYLNYVDQFGTLVWYFNSIRELGYAKTLLVQDIAEHFKVLGRRYNIHPVLQGVKGSIEELTSRADEEEIALVESALSKKWKPFPDQKSSGDSPIDVLLATNMISVGFDVDRLGLMLINGQPKNTAEYIQASSRVGRSRDGNGLVYCLYNHSRSRDRSHFENFFTYHQALYRNVEPTSITPLAPKARERALPGLIVGIARHILKIDNPTNFSDEIRTSLRDYLSEYISDAQTYSKDIGSDNVLDEIDNCLDLWKRRSDWSELDDTELKWGEMGDVDNEQNLLRPYGRSSKHGNSPQLEVLMSMRNVDGESQGKITMHSRIS